jgi:hypothetical protein
VRRATTGESTWCCRLGGGGVEPVPNSCSIDDDTRSLSQGNHPHTASAHLSVSIGWCTLDFSRLVVRVSPPEIAPAIHPEEKRGLVLLLERCAAVMGYVESRVAFGVSLKLTQRSSVPPTEFHGPPGERAPREGND